MATATKTKAKPKSAGGGTASSVKKGAAEDLSSLAASVRGLESVERAKTGSNLSWVSLAQGNSGVLQPDDPAYIKGVKQLDFVIAAKNLRLGQTVDATVLAMFSLYEQRTAPRDASESTGQLVGFWMPDDAVQVPQSGIFERKLANGDTLYPTHWVFLYLHDHPEIDNALLSFRSIGNSIYKDLEKMLKAESSIWVEKRLKIGHQAIRNEKFKKTYYYPAFEVAGANFRFEGDELKPVKGGLSADEIREVLTRSKKLQDDYAAARMVSRRTNVAALIGAPTAPALPGSSGGYDDDEDDDGEAVAF
jgi:hypothetical protein